MRFLEMPNYPMVTRLAGVCLVSTLLVACGGGGGGALPVVEASVLGVQASAVLEGNVGQTNLVLIVTLDKPVVSSVTLRYSTASLAKAGVAGAAAGVATGGSACGGAVDYIAIDAGNPVSVVIPAGGGAVVNVSFPVVCADTAFEPNERFSLVWSAGAANGTLAASIINDDAGGLNGAGVATVLGGGAAFGRDTNPLTNSNADGALGFSFANTAVGACRADNVTGLTWGTLDGFAYTQAAVAAQVAAANGVALCGFTDWRVPGVEELASLVDAAKPAEPVNADTNGATMMTGQYWSKDARVGSINDQMVVGFSSLGAISFRNKTLTAGVRLVRGTAWGDPCVGAPFVDHADGTVSDTRTGLMWKQCSEGLGGAACGTGAAIDTTTTNPVTQVNLVNAAPATVGLGYADWRIPSRQELASLVCRAAVAAPLINTTAFPATDVFSYLTSTLHPLSGQSWFVGFEVDGSVGVGSVGGKRLRLVRAGQ
jgi:hypothetical protein